ncbi:MAG: respiratory nitrate reductase subunit gamma [Alphaproteobacteria bacterium 64-11]|nr:respiratory nitrate reductase subunit gamma [Alphaproteobacteria bacterium]OJU12069.1 MAG: respiratory nitrate reductase subunit gamma [Alphaproteobacteria bacterium 64-11]
MSQAINSALFGVYPYICLTVFLVGSLIRFDREQYTWRSQSSQLLRRRQLVWGSNLFHVGILVILFGHAGGLLTPVAVFEALGISHTAKQLTAIVVGGAAGIMCLAGLLMLLHRRLSDPRIRRTSSIADIAVLFILLAQLLLGLGTIFVSLHHLDGSEMVALMSWAQHIVTFRPGAADFVAGVSPVFKTHLVLGMTIFLIFPFTRLVHIWSAPIWYLGRRGYQIVRTRRIGKA